MIAGAPHSPERSSSLETRLTEAADVLRAIRHGEIDALVVEAPGGNQVYTLHSAEEPYRTLVEQMHEGAVALTDRGDILYANASFAALVDEPLESIVGSRLDRFVLVSDRHDVEALLIQGTGRCRTRLVGSESRPVEVSLSLTTTRSSAGDRRNLIVTDLRDLLEAHSNRDLAQRENQTKDEFLATFAHELRTPLGAISAAAQLLELTRVAARSGSPRPYDVIVRQVDHMASLITDLLDVERIVSGNVRLNRQPIDIADAIRQVVATLSDAATAARQITISAEPMWVEWDVVRLQQVLANLVTNAVKYTPADGQIRVALRAEDGDAVLSVEDTGFGIAPERLPFIFDMYVQVDRTLDRAQGGLGIGLALVRRLVELHGGTVAASSDGEGRGSTFTVRLRQIAAPSHAGAASFPQERRVTQRRVLLIEDSGHARERLRAMLELAGHLVYDAADIGRGLELVRTVSPDVGIIDMRSGPVDRRLVARQFREEPHGRNMVLVSVGPPPDPSDRHDPSEDGFDFHLAEPVDVEHLARLLADEAIPGQAANQ
jgi:signal transduction histidine kinase